MRGALPPLLIGGVLLALVLASIGPGLSPLTSAVPGTHGTTVAPAPNSRESRTTQVPTAHSGRESASSPVSQAFDRRVAEVARSLAAAGVPARSIRLPYVGPPAQMVDGVVLPGYAVTSSNVSPDYSSAPAPSGLAYYGENDTAGTITATTLDASSLAGTLTVNQMDALYLDVDTPDMWGIQLNAVLGNVTLGGAAGYEFWVQNAVDVFQHNDTINLGEDTWNFSARAANIPAGTSTILSHSSNGSVIGGLYIGAGPWIHARLPFTLTLYVNSSLTAGGDQELWYNYSVLAAGGVHRAGNYDWLVFNSNGHPAPVPIAPFVATGTQLDPVGLPSDFEFDFGIGGYNGASMDVLSANVSATLDYCPISIASCTSGQFRSIPAAEDFGGETGETSSGLSVTYTGTTVSATAGPFVLRGLWGFPGATGTAAGATTVANSISVSGSPDASATVPYVFVFFRSYGTFDVQFEWAPDVPVWYLAPGTYQYDVMLADYAEQTGTLVVGTTPTSLSATLPYHPSSGVYTPLWALSNSQLAGISSSGSGSLSSQYLPFNNPTAGCTECGNAHAGNLSGRFFSHNDYLFPTFAGILLVGTDAYVEIDHPVSFSVFWFTWGPLTSTNLTFYLQIQLVSTHHVTLAHDAFVRGWPGMFETQTLAGVVNASENPFPQANVMIWNSSGDLVMSNDFVPTFPVPQPLRVYFGLPPVVTCYGCVSPDGLLLYGGTNNTVWGNTFRDPTPSAGAGVPPQSYAGLAEAESGDLVYNNNFSIDNPTVYLPFDIYNDSCPDGYAGDCGPLVPPAYSDAWNVPDQSAADVSATVNGFALSGNVLGLACEVQGGNYWNDYGNPENPTGALPFLNRYNYSEIVPILPPGSSAVQASILVGGDSAPLTRSSCGVGPTHPVRFHESGLGTHAPWGVSINGHLLTSSNPWINATLPDGTVTFAVTGPLGFGVARITGPHTPTFTSANITGPTVLGVQFGPLETLYFNESIVPHWPGLPTGTNWSVTLTPSAHGGPPGMTTSTTGSSINFTVAKGTAYRFLVSKPSSYQPAGGKGGLTMPARTLTKLVRFRLFTSTVTFLEHGLRYGTSWSVNVTGPINETLYGTTSALKFFLTNGSYTFTVPSVGSDQPAPGTGTLTITAPHGQTQLVAFAPEHAPSASDRAARPDRMLVDPTRSPGVVPGRRVT